MRISLISRAEKPSDASSSKDESDSGGLELVAEELLEALEKQDAKMVAKALRSAVRLCGYDEE